MDPARPVVRPGTARAAIRRLALFGLSIYLAVVVMLAFLQRRLIYLPTRQPQITPQAANLPPGRVQTITLTTVDGLQLRGWHLAPEGDAVDGDTGPDAPPELGDRLVVMYFPGNAGHRAWRVDDFALFTRLGCEVLAFDYRGYGDNPGSPSERLLAADATSAWNYATDVRRIDPKRLILVGESLGGGVAVRLAAEQSAAGVPPGGLVLRATFDRLPNVAAYHCPWLPVRWVMVERYPSIERIRQMTCPILQMHGNRDTIIPLQLGRRLFDAAPPQSAEGVAKRFVELDGADHNDIWMVAQAECETAIAEFLNEIRARRERQ